MATKRKRKYDYPPPLQVRAPAELREAIKELAANEERSLNSYLLVLLKNHVEAARSARAAEDSRAAA